MYVVILYIQSLFSSNVGGKKKTKKFQNSFPRKWLFDYKILSETQNFMNIKFVKRRLKIYISTNNNEYLLYSSHWASC